MVRTLEELLPGADHLVVAAPLTPRTHHLLDGNVTQKPAEQAQIGEQDEPAEYRDASEMRRKENRVDERRFAHGREQAELLD